MTSRALEREPDRGAPHLRRDAIASRVRPRPRAFGEGLGRVRRTDGPAGGGLGAKLDDQRRQELGRRVGLRHDAPLDEGSAPSSRPHGQMPFIAIWAAASIGRHLLDHEVAGPVDHGEAGRPSSTCASRQSRRSGSPALCDEALVVELDRVHLRVERDVLQLRSCRRRCWAGRASATGVRRRRDRRDRMRSRARARQTLPETSLSHADALSVCCSRDAPATRPSSDNDTCEKRP